MQRIRALLPIHTSGLLQDALAALPSLRHRRLEQNEHGPQSLPPRISKNGAAVRKNCKRMPIGECPGAQSTAQGCRSFTAGVMCSANQGKEGTQNLAQGGRLTDAAVSIDPTATSRPAGATSAQPQQPMRTTQTHMHIRTYSSTKKQHRQTHRHTHTHTWLG